MKNLTKILMLLLLGLGYGQQLVVFYYVCHYIVILAWAFLYLFSSFNTELLWSSCNNTWNTGTGKVTGFKVLPFQTIQGEEQFMWDQLKFMYKLMSYFAFSLFWRELFHFGSELLDWSCVCKCHISCKRILAVSSSVFCLFLHNVRLHRAGENCFQNVSNFVFKIWRTLRVKFNKQLNTQIKHQQAHFRWTKILKNSKTLK